MRVAEARVATEGLLVKHGLWDQGWRFKLSRAKSRLGLCKHGTKQISISGAHIVQGTNAEVMDTILHEIAHAMVGPGNGHNWTWKEKALEIGARATRCATVLSYKQLHKYNLVCGHCEKTLGGRHRRTNMSSRYHPGCGRASLGKLFFERA